MKYIYKILILSFIAFGVTSCDENENFEIFPAQDSFQIVTPSSGSVIVLDDTNLANNALFISWKSTTGSSGSTYTIEVAETGTDFGSPITLGTTQDNNFGMTVEELNTFLLDVMGLNPEEAVSIDVRVSTNGEVSQTISVVITPYKVEYTELYLVGNITDPEWSPEDALALTNVDLNIFEITLDLADGAEFKFLPTNTSFDGDWGEDPNNPGNLIVEGEQNLGGYTAGKYKITVDLNTFTFTVDAIVAPENLFLVGNITDPQWNPGAALPFFKSAENVFTVVVNLSDGAEFKFLPTNTSFDGDWGEDPNNPGNIIQDGEQNISGLTAGKYLVTVDFNTLTYNLTSVDNLFLVGNVTDPQWSPDASISMGEASLGIFSTVIDLADGAEFKFLPTNTSFDGDWGEDPNNPGRIILDGEQNLNGFAAGKYVVAVNFNTLSYTISSLTSVPTNLYLVGSFRGPWSNDASDPQFTEISAGVFEITQTLSADDEFKFVREAGSWDNDLGENKISSRVLEQNDEQNLKVTADGSYVITVNFNDGTITIN